MTWLPFFRHYYYFHYSFHYHCAHDDYYDIDAMPCAKIMTLIDATLMMMLPQRTDARKIFHALMLWTWCLIIIIFSPSLFVATPFSSTPPFILLLMRCACVQDRAPLRLRHVTERVRFDETFFRKAAYTWRLSPRVYHTPSTWGDAYDARAPSNMPLR